MFDVIRQWASRGLHRVPKHLSSSNTNLENPVCSACFFVKCTSTSTTKSQRRFDQQSRSPWWCGISWPHGFWHPRFDSFRAGWASNRRYTHATMWVDNFSRFISSHLQDYDSAAATISSKEDFEDTSKCYDHHIKHCQSDNGIFRSTAFLQHCRTNGQPSSFYGVGVHWQSGIVEVMKKVISEKAESMLWCVMSLYVLM